MERLQLGSTIAANISSSPTLVLGPYLALTGARTAGVRLFERRPPVHSILLGACHLQLNGRQYTASSIALPAGTPHKLLELSGSHACVAYLDPRRYRFEDVERLARRWQSFVPGQDDLREAFGDALALPKRRVDARLIRALEALDTGDQSVPSAAAAVAMSASRLTHLLTETLGSPPRTWRAYFKLRRAIAEALLGSANITRAAHHAGFADSAHFTRTCKQLMGVRPAQMLPRTVYVSNALD
jgi:AraC-like DNA-binding protein